MKKIYLVLITFFLLIFSAFGSGLSIEAGVSSKQFLPRFQLCGPFVTSCGFCGTSLLTAREKIVLVTHYSQSSQKKEFTIVNEKNLNKTKLSSNDDQTNIPNKTDRNILITGASGDIGIALAENFLAKGYFVIGHYAHNRKPLRDLQKKYPKNVALIECDFTQPKKITVFWEKVLKLTTRQI